MYVHVLIVYVLVLNPVRTCFQSYEHMFSIVNGSIQSSRPVFCDNRSVRSDAGLAAVFDELSVVQNLLELLAGFGDK